MGEWAEAGVTVDPNLVQAVLDEEWGADAQFVTDGMRVVLTPSRAAHSTGADAVIERARQAALGHRALRYLVELSVDHRLQGCPPDCEACAIVAELRGGK